LRAVVGPQHLWQPVVALELLEDAHQALRRDRRVDFDVQRLAIEVVDHIEGPEAPAAGQGVGNEVGRPDRVGQPGDVERHPLAPGQAPLRGPSEVQLHSLVHPVDALVVPLRPPAPQQLAALPEAPAGTVLDQPGQRRDQLGITDRPVQWRPVPGRPRQPNALTGPAQGPCVHLDQVPHRLALLLRPYSFSAIRSFIAALSSASSAYIRLSLLFSASNSLTRFRSDASMPPYLDFHW